MRYDCSVYYRTNSKNYSFWFGDSYFSVGRFGHTSYDYYSAVKNITRMPSAKCSYYSLKRTDDIPGHEAFWRLDITVPPYTLYFGNDLDDFCTYLQEFLSKRHHEEEWLSHGGDATAQPMITTAGECLTMCREHGLGFDGKEVTANDFQIIINNLLPGEYIIFPFIAAPTMSLRACAVTNKRVVRAVYEARFLHMRDTQSFLSVDWRDIVGISLTGRSGEYKCLQISTSGSPIYLYLYTYASQEIYRLFDIALDKAKNPIVERPMKPGDGAPDFYDTLKKLKELLDAGILTREEFDAKKKQVLAIDESSFLQTDVSDARADTGEARLRSAPPVDLGDPSWLWETGADSEDADLDEFGPDDF